MLATQAAKRLWRDFLNRLRSWRTEWRDQAAADADFIAECGEYPPAIASAATDTFLARHPKHGRRLFWSAARGMWAYRMGRGDDRSMVIYGPDRWKLVAMAERAEAFERVNPTVR